MKETYITLADYAISLGISLEEAEKKLKRPENNRYFKELGGVAFVSTSIPDYQEEKAGTKEEDGPATPTQKENTDEINQLRQEIEELRQSVKEKESIIKQKDEQLIDFALRFADLAQQAQIIAGQSQILQAADKPKAIETQTAAKKEEQPMKKKGFFNRLFGR